MTDEPFGRLQDRDDLESPSCPLCEADRPSLLATRPEWGIHRVVSCRTCRFVYLSPRPTEWAMRAMYQRDDYFGDDANESDTSGYSAYREQERALRMTFARWLSRLSRAGLVGGSLLEVGCGYGYLLDEAAPFFDRREGTEYSGKAAKAAAKRADAVYHGGLEDVPAEARYDVILSNQVIEHVHAPRRFLEAKLSHLRPGGTIAIATPWMRSPWYYALRSRWPSFKIPEHLLYFDSSALARMMREAGLGRIQRFAYPHAFPLGLVLAKLGWASGGAIGRLPLWIPGTTLAMVGVLEEGRFSS